MIAMRFLLTMILFGVLAPPSFAQKRGIEIQYKTRAAKDAPVAGTVSLYPKSYALVIGNDLYNNGWSRLSNGVKDAEEVASALKAIGFRTTLKRNLERRDLSRSIEDWIFEYGGDPDARLFIWYAGHGHTDDLGEGYIVPVDAPLPSSDDFQFKRYALNMRRFGEWVRAAKSKHVYAVFDSCFAGTVFNSARSAPPPAITLATTKPVRQFLTSGDANQTVSDDGTFRRLFVEALEGQRSADANGDGFLTASELGLFMGDQITNLSSGTQTPRYGKLRDPNFNMGDFVFANVNSATPNAEKPLESSYSTLSAIEVLENRAADGDMEAQHELGLTYAKGLLNQKVDFRKARKYFEAAANQGKMLSQYWLGELYFKGQGVAKDYQKAYQYYSSSVLGESELSSKNQLGWFYYTGTVVQQDLKKARSLFLDVALKGGNPDGSAEQNLANMMENGLGGGKDISGAVKWYSVAADKGDPQAMNNLGVMYAFGKGVTKNVETALNYMERAFNAGYSTSGFNIGYVFYYGVGVKSDPERGILWFKKAANAGNANAKKKLRELGIR